MISIESNLCRIYISFTGTIKTTQLLYILYEMMFAIPFNDVILLETY